MKAEIKWQLDELQFWTDLEFEYCWDTDDSEFRSDEESDESDENDDSDDDPDSGPSNTEAVGGGTDTAATAELTAAEAVDEGIQ